MEGKKDTLKIIAISVIVSIVVCIISIIIMSEGISVNDFKIESFNMDTEKSIYGSNYTYSGEGKVTCKRKTGYYEVLIKKTDKANNKAGYTAAIVKNGEGELSTYDSTYTDENTKKPDYEFEIVAYKEYKTN